MNDSVLMGHGPEMIEVPWSRWRRHLDDVPAHSRERLAFMTDDHRRVRNHAVLELVRRGRRIEPGAISQALNLSIDRILEILDDLERRLFFLVRDESGAVLWAYPVTAAPTPHELEFRSGERLYGA